MMQLSQAAECARDLLWLDRTRRWSAEQIREYQRAALRRILRHAVATVPYYRALGVPDDALERPDGLSAFPLLTRTQIQEQADRLLSDTFDHDRLYVSRSSGSTGRPVSIRFDPAAWVLTKYALKLRRTLADLRRPPYRVLIVGEESGDDREGSPRSLAAVARASIHGSAEAQLSLIERFRPNGIYGPPSWLLELSRAAQAQRRVVAAPRVIWTSSEVLTAAARREISARLGCPVRDIYGNTELKEVAVECPNGRRHINFESSYVEVLGGPDGGPGPLVVTSLVNRGMPLIRYRTGDVGRLVHGACGCGRAAPWLDEIGGREVDLIELPDGDRLSPYVLSTVIEAQAGIARYQLLQLAPDAVEVRYQLRAGLETPDIDALARELSRVVAGRLRFSFRQVEHVERTQAGKLRPLIRAVDGS